MAAYLVLAFIVADFAMASPAPADEKAVTFIFLADQNGQRKMNPQTNPPVVNGTGFLVVVENEA